MKRPKSLFVILGLLLVGESSSFDQTTSTWNVVSLSYYYCVCTRTTTLECTEGFQRILDRHINYSGMFAGRRGTWLLKEDRIYAQTHTLQQRTHCTKSVTKRV